jgi:uncharacterized protein YprB with RNaseH-like and TPR domain
MNLAERLRGVIRTGGSASPVLSGAEGRNPPGVPRPGSAESSDPAEPACPGDIADTLGGEWREGRGERYLIVERTYHPGYRLGRVTVADCLPEDGRWPRMELLLTEPWSGIPAGPAMFLDLETTGLAGGAGTYAFLVGCGWFDGAVFRVRQFVLTSVAAERALLQDVAALVRAAGVLVTYNGKTFDAPLIDTRFLFHRLATPCTGLTHLDLIHPARRLWSPSRLRRSGERPAADVHCDEGGASCRLSLMEQTILGHVREDDVPGFEIPSRYFQFVRSGDARGLDGVLEHNRLDLLALAMLTARAGQLLHEGAPAARTSREALGLGRLYERGGLVADARVCFARAIDFDDDPHVRVEALRASAILSRRERRYADAADAWRRMLSMCECPSRWAQEATEALAVHHEHRARDLVAARRYAMQALQFDVTRSRTLAVHHRLARIDRKRGEPLAQPAPLF